MSLADMGKITDADKRRNFDQCVAFGEALLDTRDLDPVYCAIVGAELPGNQVKRLLLSYWCYYSLGVSAYLSAVDGDLYWIVSRVAAENATPSPLGGRWPRGAERRHFRGAKCVAAIDWLAAKGPPEKLVNDLGPWGTSKDIMERVQEWPLFGPWISFKAVDMCERCLGDSWPQVPPSVPLIYKEPRAALDLLPSVSYELLLRHFAARRAPPALDRPCGPAEVETILCKFKSHFSGQYQIGKDIHEIREALVGWGPTANRLLAAMPVEVVSSHHG